MDIPPDPNQPKMFKFTQRSFGHKKKKKKKKKSKEVFSLHGSQIERGYITMRQTTSPIVMYACCLQRRKVELFESW